MKPGRRIAVRRPTLNFVVDCIGFTGFVLLATSGVLMRYVLPPGSGHFTTVWGMDRHEWGSIHFWVAVGFLSVLALHLWLHWRWIVTVLRGRPREGSGARIALGLVGLIALLALVIAPLLSPVERAEGTTRVPGIRSSSLEADVPVRGFMTLEEIERSTGVPAEHVLHELGLPSDIDRDERVGRLARAHGFTMERIRRIVQAHREGEPHPSGH